MRRRAQDARKTLPGFPMQLSRYLITRIIAVSAVILLAGLALALWRAQYDVQREERGALEIVRLFEHLYALENGPAADVDAHVEALRRINDDGRLRHIQLDLRDAAGTLRVAPHDSEPSGMLERAFALTAPGMRSVRVDPSGPWTLARDDDARFVAALSLDPSSEQREALDNLVGMLLVLLGYGAALLGAVYWALRRALAPLQPMLQAIGRYERDDFAYRLPPLPFAEMDRIGRALNHLAATLSSTQETRRVLSLKLVSSQEEERARIARELHDELGQTLTAMRADVAWLSHRTTADAALREVVDGLARHCEDFHLQVRDLLRRLRPQGAATASGVPLRQLLCDLVQSWRDRPGRRAEYSLSYALDDGTLSGDLALALYRLTQEALTNAARHADATRVAVRVDARKDGAIEWCVEDDGVGLDSTEAAPHRGHGLAGMRERVWAHGGEIEMGPAANGSAERAGLRIRARFRAAEGMRA
jgi:two-component system, NarL family, sensor histidine kinase UhpB